ncbi:peptidase A4 family-domain-containing protein [Boletus reticuloceps]|uniref:Peptidase A4 family-domain-containing protein n=1 Tax=Boletus reticuloceps TaxID=495285 RepID=A0A8I2YJ07_9AGAM|nr:peptidase A4 family-domain-containing protein [Boletus reticuloceps]
MHFKSALISTFLFVSAVLAGRHHEKYQSQGWFPNLAKQYPNSDHGGVYFSNTWTGAFWNETDGTFAVVTSTFTVPAISGPNGSGASIRIGIDDLTCTSANILAGIDLSVTENETRYKAFSQWWPHDKYFYNLTIATADVIRTTANVLSSTSGAVLVENLTNGQTVVQQFNTTPALCGRSAAWGVSDKSTIPSGMVTFTNATAYGPGGTYTPERANIVRLERNHQNLSNVNINGSSVTIWF